MGVEFDLNLEPGVVSDMRIVVISNILSNETDLVVAEVVAVVVVDVVVVVVVAVVVVVVVAVVVVVEVVVLGALDDVVLVVVDLPFNLIKRNIYFQKFQILLGLFLRKSIKTFIIIFFYGSYLIPICYQI